VTARTAWQAILIGLVITFGCGAVLITPVDRSDYHDAALNSAGGSLSAVQVVDQLCWAQLHHQTVRPYVRTMLADAREAAATAQQDLGRLDVPDSESARLRDELAPLLERATAAVGTAGLALAGGDRQTIRDAQRGLEDVAGALETFIEENQ
jgi:hypothetical protein